MKLGKKIINVLLCIGLLTINTIPAFAEVDELWGVPFLAYGASLNESQRDEILELFGLTGLVQDEDFEAIYVTGDDLVYFLGMGNPNSNMLSSVIIRHRAPGTGVEVDILTPDYITRVTATQYATAMITAGVTDALVEVAAPTAVTGEAALTGIYKAFAERGVELDPKRMAVAQEQLQIMAGIANDLAYHRDFDSELLDSAVMELQGKLADHYEQTGRVATPDEIAEFVSNVLSRHNLQDLLTHEHIERLRGFAGNFQLTDAIRSQEFRDQLSSLGNRIGNAIGNINLDRVNLDIDRGVIANWWHSIVEWFRGLFN